MIGSFVSNEACDGTLIVWNIVRVESRKIKPKPTAAAGPSRKRRVSFARNPQAWFNREDKPRRHPSAAEAA